MSGGELAQALRDAGCDEAAAEEFMKLRAQGQTAKARRLLSRHRKELLDLIHAGEDKIRCLDYLIYEMDRSV